MEFESINEALIACTKACGGSKTVGAALWPDVAPEQAQRKLLAALDDTRPEKLAPSQAMFVLRMARDKGYHLGMAYMLAELGYAPTTPIEPVDQIADLVRNATELLAAQQLATARLEKALGRVTLKVAA